MSVASQAESPVPQVHVVDLGVGNIRSLTSALEFLGVRYVVGGDPRLLDGATHVILPGVGSFDAAMRAMAQGSLVEPLREFAVVRGKPLLGVCLGMQLLCEGSDEGSYAGLGLIAGSCRTLVADISSHQKVPHVGFASVYGFAREKLFKEIPTPCEFYFTHSYGLQATNDESLNVMWCDHSRPFVAAFQRVNVCGVQFHPEKSQSTGLRLLSNFCELTSGI